MAQRPVVENAAPPVGAPRRILRYVTTSMNSAGALIILAAGLIVCVDVIARNLFNSPFFGVAEMLSMSIVAIVFLQLPHAIASGRMIRSEVLLEALKTTTPRAGELLNRFHMLCGALFLAAIVWGVWPQLVDAYKYNLFSGMWIGLQMPVWPVRAIIIVGSALGCLAYLLNVWLGERRL